MSGEVSTCCTCGHTWPTGNDGSHSCTRVLRALLADFVAAEEASRDEFTAKEIDRLEAVLDRANRVLGQNEAPLRNKSAWDVKMEVSVHPPISERRIADLLNQGWDLIGMAMNPDNIHYAYFSRRRASAGTEL